MEPLTTVRERALRDVEHHLLCLVHDSGHYRHMLYRAPGRWEFWFEIITSPGTLTVHGDMGTYVFARDTDMVGWFVGSSHEGKPNIGYWAEKCVSHGGRRGLQEYSHEKMLAEVERELLTIADEEALHPAFYGKLRRDVHGELDGVDTADEREVLDVLRGLQIAGQHPFEDAYEWDVHEYEYNFQWTCHTLLAALQKYRAGDFLEPVRSKGWADVSNLVSAWTVPGPAPAVHYAQQARLAREWPTLHNAITTITKGTK